MKIVMLLSGEETIKLDGNTDNNKITSVEFLSDRESQDIDGPSGRTIKVITVKGKVGVDTKEATRKLLEWSFKTNEKDALMTLKITMDNGPDASFREYTLNNMYCLSYKEHFAAQGGGKDDTFELIMKQLAQDNTTYQVKSEF